MSCRHSGGDDKSGGGMNPTARRCWRFVARNMTTPLAEYLNIIDGDYERHRDYRMRFPSVRVENHYLNQGDTSVHFHLIEV
jgi:hypothetical protein